MAPRSTSTSIWVKIVIASIPVIGTIVIALIPYVRHNPPIKQELSVIKRKAGDINDIVVYGRYDDLLPVMSDAMRKFITPTVFNRVLDSIRQNLGTFIKPIDTVYSSAFNVDNVFIKNQYQKGTNVNQIIFDKEGHLFGLFCTTSDRQNPDH